MVSVKTHSVMDYVIGVLLIIAPALFGFSSVDAARNIFMILGVGLIAYSLLTNYKYSLLKIIPLGVHMTLDVLLGVVLVLAPWLFGYRDELTTGQLILHFVMGFGAAALVAVTQPKTDEAITTRGYHRRSMRPIH